MKLKFIFNKKTALIWPLAVVIACVAPIFAQQSTATPPQGTVPSNAAPSAVDPPPDDGTQSMLPHTKDTRLWLSGQANFVFQTHPDFHALYSGTHSLSPNYEKATSRLMT